VKFDLRLGASKLFVLKSLKKCLPRQAVPDLGDTFAVVSRHRAIRLLEIIANFWMK